MTQSLERNYKHVTFKKETQETFFLQSFVRLFVQLSKRYLLILKRSSCKTAFFKVQSLEENSDYIICHTKEFKLEVRNVPCETLMCHHQFSVAQPNATREPLQTPGVTSTQQSINISERVDMMIYIYIFPKHGT